MSGQAGAVTEREEEIKVTPEMVEAGVLLLFSYDPDFANEEDVVRKIMALAAQNPRDCTRT